MSILLIMELQYIESLILEGQRMSLPYIVATSSATNLGKKETRK